jgi:5-dehydro-2-deoxygluconokinase
MSAPHRLDVITIGRSSVDLYGQQIGGRLEDMGSFAKSVGGSPTNMAIGAARLGLKVGIDHPRRRRADGPLHPRTAGARGRRHDGVVTDPKRLTALVILGVRDDRTFPHIFYRTDCADMALSRGRHRSGFHRLGRRDRGHRNALLDADRRGGEPQGDAARRRRPAAGRLRRRLPSEPLGSRRACRRRGALHSSAAVTAAGAVVADCDLIVGTEEELMIAGGAGRRLPR